MSLADIRSKFPQYDDMSDGDLAYRMYINNYSDMPMGIFADKLDLSKREFAEMIVSAKDFGYEPTVRGQSVKRVDYDIGATGLLRSIAQGMTFGGADEIVSGGAAIGRKIQGDERAIGDIYQQGLKAERDRLEQYRETDPVKAGVAEFAGAVAVPMGAVKGVKSAVGAGAGTGAATGFLSAKDDRLEAGGYGALFGGLLGPAFYKGGELASTQFAKLFKDRARKAAAEGAPALEQLKREASEAYTKAKNSGAIIDPNQYREFVETVITSVSGKSKVQQQAMEELMPKLSTVKRMLEGSVGEQLGLEDLESLRRIAKIPAGDITNPDQQRAAMNIVNSIDDLMENIQPSQLQGDLFQEQFKKEVGGAFKDARSMWSKVRKTEAMDELIEKAGTYAGGLESGIKNQLSTILRNPKQQRGYTKAELDMMREIVEGTPVGNLIGGISQLGLSTSGGRNVFNIGSGLATAGATGAVLGGPMGAVIGMAGEITATTALRHIREQSMANQVKIMRDLIASGRMQEFAATAPEAFNLLKQAAQKVGQGAIITTTPELQRSKPRGLLAQ